MHWDAYTAFSVITGMLCIGAAFMPDMEPKSRAWVAVAGLLSVGYGLYVAAQTRGVYHFSVVIFVLPVVALIYVIVKIVVRTSGNRPGQPARVPAVAAASQPRGAVTHSPDGSRYWTGVAWEPAMSDDGRNWWNGAEWISFSAPGRQWWDGSAWRYPGDSSSSKDISGDMKTSADVSPQGGSGLTGAVGGGSWAGGEPRMPVELDLDEGLLDRTVIRRRPAAPESSGQTGHPVPRFCGMCGQALTGGDRFCSGCGAATV